jgi:putative membrane protein
MTPPEQYPARARDHLANERTFLAWVRTGVAVVVFGFAIGRFAIAIRELLQMGGTPPRTAGWSVWFGIIAIVTGVLLIFVGLNRYRRVRQQLDTGSFQPAGFIIDLVAIFTCVFGAALAAYLIYIQESIR